MAWFFTVKVVLLSSWVVLMALAMRVSAPLALELMASHVPHLWSSVVSWLRPPYLYVVINGIIITIAASSRFHHHEDGDPHHHDYHQEISSSSSATASVSEDHHHDLGYDGDDDHDDQEVKVVSPEFRMTDQTVVLYQPREEELIEDVPEQVKTVVELPVDYSYAEAQDENHDDDDQDHPLVIVSAESTRMETPPPQRIIDQSEEGPLVSPRVGNRKPVKASPEGGKALKAVMSSKQKRHESMENTWKAIMEARSRSLTRQSKNWQGLENQGRPIIGFGDLEVDQAPLTPTMKKSETFKDRTNQQQPAVATISKLKKEPSLSQDELNRRVEEFINKFNEQMRLQRQESLNRYMEMINRGTH